MRNSAARSQRDVVTSNEFQISAQLGRTERVLGRETSACASQSSLCHASSARLGQAGGLHLPIAPGAGKTQKLPNMPDSTHFQPPNSLGDARTLLPWVRDLPPPPTPTALVLSCCHTLAVGTGCVKAAVSTDGMGSVSKEHFG